MKRLVLILIAGALASPVFAEPRSANSNEIGANTPVLAAAQDALIAQPAASSAFAQVKGTDNSNKITKKKTKKHDDYYEFTFLDALRS